MKTCTKCRTSKDESEFYFKDVKTGRLNSKCKACLKEVYQDHYAANREKYIERAKENRKTSAKRNRRFVLTYLEEHPCVDCGEDDIDVLQFDHRDRDLKVCGPSELVTNSLDTLKAEIAKCDVRCANCHMRRTSKQLGWRSHSTVAQR